MPWGSNITGKDVPIFDVDFQPGVWSQIGANKRAEDTKNKATMAVAEARKGVREKFSQDRENKAYAAEKARLEELLKTAQDELAEINMQLEEAQSREQFQEQKNAAGSTLGQAKPAYDSLPPRPFATATDDQSGIMPSSTVPLFNFLRNR